jgi:molybdenum cofactor cytidylyltransferase
VASPDRLNLEAILLAAGRSRRMEGVNKLLLRIGGVPMVRRSACLFLDLGVPLIVVTASDNRRVAEALAGLDAKLVVNADADTGQQSSVRAGLAATPLRAAGVVVALSDQPLLTTGDIRALAAVFEQHGGTRIAVPRYTGQRGNPVIFPTAIARQLGAPGAPAPRAFIDAHPEAVAWFDAPSDHFIRDVDTPGDAAELLGANAAHGA